jgi:RNA polymerase sigma factor (sigma-70 family)
MSSRVAPVSQAKRPYVVAMVLGTALSAFGPAQAAPALTSESTTRAITDLGRYCTTCWRNARLPADSWNDCTQEVFRRLLERVPSGSWDQVLRAEGQERREFLRAIDAVKKRTQRARKWSGSLEGVADRREREAGRLREERETVRRAAEDLLSPRQQRILQMSFEGWSVQDVARELRLPAERVSDEKYKAVRKLRAHLGPAGNPDGNGSGLPA